MNAGAHGGTVLFGRGIGRNELQRVFGIQIEPEKEIVLTVVPSEQKDVILGEIVRAAGLNAPGKGLAFILPVEKVGGRRPSRAGAPSMTRRAQAERRLDETGLGLVDRWFPDHQSVGNQVGP